MGTRVGTHGDYAYTPLPQERESILDSVLWVCLSTPHQRSMVDELRSFPEEGPNIMALAKVKHSAIMVLNGSAQLVCQI